MQLPNKLYSYKKSTLAQIPIVLDAIKNGPYRLLICTSKSDRYWMMQQILCLLWIVCIL